MRRSPRESSRPVRAALAILGALFACGAPSLAADPSSDDFTEWPEGVRAFRTLDRHGNSRMVLTNLDAAGHPLPGASTPSTDIPPAGRTCRPEEDEAAEAGRSRAAETEPDGAGGGGTTIVININNAPATPPEPVAVPVYALPVAYGGLVGPFRYPENHHFLGYGTGVGSPSFFGGLGLNAGNGFGLKTGAPCGTGFDCMFGPAAGGH